MPSAFQIKSFLTYWLDAVDEHSLHSPFFYDFYTRIVKGTSSLSEFSAIESLRNKLLQSDQSVSVTDLGAGSRVLNGDTRKISDIAAVSLSSQKYSLFYSRMVRHFQCMNIVELGTSLGINALYLGSAAGRVTTFEGSSEIAQFAKSTVEFYGSADVSIREGNIDDSLPSFLRESGKIDLAFMDANHRYEPTLRYAEWLMKNVHLRSIIIIDDIHHTAEMEKAWHFLRKHSLVYGSADLYRCGILFFDPSLNKQHVVMQF